MALTMYRACSDDVGDADDDDVVGDDVERYRHQMARGIGLRDHHASGARGSNASAANGLCLVFCPGNASR